MIDISNLEEPGKTTDVPCGKLQNVEKNSGLTARDQIKVGHLASVKSVKSVKSFDAFDAFDAFELSRIRRLTHKEKTYGCVLHTS